MAIVALSYGFAAGALGVDNAASAWWLTARFTPSAREVAGLPVGSIDSSWIRASSLEELPLPPEASARGESVADHGGSFSLKQDFDSDGAVETVVVGVYETRSGGAGRFLLVLGQSASGSATVLAKFLDAGVAGFSVLHRDGDRITWATCMECDDFSSIRYHGGAFYLQHESCEDCG